MSSLSLIFEWVTSKLLIRERLFLFTNTQKKVFTCNLNNKLIVRISRTNIVRLFVRLNDSELETSLVQWFPMWPFNIRPKIVSYLSFLSSLAAAKCMHTGCISSWLDSSWRLHNFDQKHQPIVNMGIRF